MGARLFSNYIASGDQIASGTIALSKLNALTTKGDLLSYSTTHARLGIGTDGQVLTADSGEATGIKWATPTTAGLTYEGGTTLSNASASITVSNLDLATDKQYLFIANIKLTSGSPALRLYAGHSAGTIDTTNTNYYKQQSVVSNGVYAGARANDANMFDAEGMYQGFIFEDVNGYPRAIMAGNSVITGSGLCISDYVWYWGNNTNNLDALKIQSSSETMTAGSFLKIWKMNE